jgi:hypothetical protein
MEVNEMAIVTPRKIRKIKPNEEEKDLSYVTKEGGERGEWREVRVDNDNVFVLDAFLLLFFSFFSPSGNYLFTIEFDSSAPPSLIL